METDYMEDLGMVDERLLFKYILNKIGWKDVDWVCLVQDRTSG
jgi:hypothetical protein